MSLKELLKKNEEQRELIEELQNAFGEGGQCRLYEKPGYEISRIKKEILDEIIKKSMKRIGFCVRVYQIKKQEVLLELYLVDSDTGYCVYRFPSGPVTSGEGDILRITGLEFNAKIVKPLGEDLNFYISTKN